MPSRARELAEAVRNMRNTSGFTPLALHSWEVKVDRLVAEILAEPEVPASETVKEMREAASFMRSGCKFSGDRTIDRWADELQEQTSAKVLAQTCAKDLESRLEAAERRIAELETAIKTHRDQRGDDRCWLDDSQLYRILGDKTSCDSALPPKCEFLESCSRFWEQRQHPGDQPTIRAAHAMTIRQLQARVAELETAICRAAEAVIAAYLESRKE